MARAKNGEAVGPARRTRQEQRALRLFIRESERSKDLDAWRRGKAVLGYLKGRRVVDMAAEMEVDRSAVNRWLTWFNALGVEGLRTGKAPGRAPKLDQDERDELAAVIDAGPQAAGFTAGVWTSPMLRDWIERRFAVRYHVNYVPRLLDQLGFSVQRPRKRLARADAEAQAHWIRVRLPAIKKKPPRAEASSRSRTKPASGSTARSTEPGPE